jgi:hypothetical protein
MAVPRSMITPLILGLGALTVLLGVTWVDGMAQKSRHYAAQAAIQARLEAHCREEEARLNEPEGESGGPGGLGDPTGLMPDSEEHAALRRKYERLACHPWERPPADLPMPFPWDRDRDCRVIEAALDDVLDPRNPENAIVYEEKGGPDAEVVLHELTATLDWSDRGEPAGERPEELAEKQADSDLSRRNGGGVFPVRELGLSARRLIRSADLVQLDDEALEKRSALYEYFQERFPRACGWLDVTLPGYSRDGKTSIVVFVRYSGGHAAIWSYALRLTPTGWRVARRKRDFTE